jgi:hypothetical protein
MKSKLSLKHVCMLPASSLTGPSAVPVVLGFRLPGTAQSGTAGPCGKSGFPVDCEETETLRQRMFDFLVCMKSNTN